jgi:hypothetical protein
MRRPVRVADDLHQLRTTAAPAIAPPKSFALKK